MKVSMFAVWDDKAKAYLQPFFMANSATAVRALKSAANDPSHGFCQHPEDYTLFRIGEFDDQTGTLVPLSAPETVTQVLALKEIK